MRKFSLLLSFVLLVSFAFAQQKGRVSVTIFNGQKSPVENATIELLRSKDSALVKTALTDKAGLAEFENISFNAYLLRVSAVGLNTIYTAPFTVNENQASVELPS